MNPLKINPSRINNEIYKELQKARNKMEIACQNGGKKKAWRRFGKQVCALERQYYGYSTTAEWFEKKSERI